MSINLYTPKYPTCSAGSMAKLYNYKRLFIKIEVRIGEGYPSNSIFPPLLPLTSSFYVHVCSISFCYMKNGLMQTKWPIWHAMIFWHFNSRRFSTGMDMLGMDIVQSWLHWEIAIEPAGVHCNQIKNNFGSILAFRTLLQYN